MVETTTGFRVKDYSRGSNTQHVRILNGPKLFGWWMVRFSNAWDFLGCHLVLLWTGSNFEWLVLVYSCSYSPHHSLTEPHQHQSLKRSDLDWVLNLNVRFSSLRPTILWLNKKFKYILNTIILPNKKSRSSKEMGFLNPNSPFFGERGGAV